MNFDNKLLSLSGTEAKAIYHLLKEKENSLESCLLQLLNRIERFIYENLTIEELEKLNKDISKIDFNAHKR